MVSPSAGQSGGEVVAVTLSVDASDMSYGTYSAVLEVADPAAFNSPREVVVTLVVGQWLYVPNDYATIQAAIDAAFDHDIVELADGTYTGLGNKDLDFAGKAIAVRSASGDPESCIIDCEGDGRGFYFHSGEGPSSAIAGLTITNGSISGSGGGVYCSGSSPTLSNCAILHNAASNSGGGIYCGAGSPTLINCTINRCWANTGGGVYCVSGSPTLTNCTISGNSATCYSGGGVYCGGSSPTLTNCIVWDNAPEAIYVASGAPVVTYSGIEGGWEGTGNIDADPLLTPDGHLRSGSPCFDTGDPDGEYEGQTDIDGEPREMGGRVDMGSDEWLDTDADGLPDWWEELYFGDPLVADPLEDEDGDGRTNLAEYEAGTDPWQGTRSYYVDVAGDDEWDGLAPEWDGEHGPKATIQAAIDSCHPVEGDEVLIAAGVYTGSGNKDLDFAGKAIAVRSASGDPESCIIDCEGDGRGFYFHSGEGPSSVVAGLTIMNGSSGDDGGGVYCDGSSPTLTDCRILNNTAW